MLDFDTTALENNCRTLMASCGNRLSWKWDDRFETVLAEFKSSDAELIRDILSTHMDVSWNVDNAGTAPEVIQMVVDYFGGLQPGQVLLTSDPARDDLMLCAWWPWSNGKTISVRLAVFADSLSDDDNNALTHLFKRWFRV